MRRIVIKQRKFILGVVIANMALAMIACSSVKKTSSWTNESYQKYSPQKILIIGVTPNITARKIFEDKLAYEFNSRGVKASTSTIIFEDKFLEYRQSEEQIQEEIDNLLKLGFDSILITAVKGVDQEQSYSRGYARTDYYWRRFRGYYFVFQDIYYTPGYYENYKVYHIESSLFNIKANAESSSLVWVANFDLVDPREIEHSINDYVKSMVKELENELILPHKN